MKPQKLSKKRMRRRRTLAKKPSKKVHRTLKAVVSVSNWFDCGRTKIYAIDINMYSFSFVHK